MGSAFKRFGHQRLHRRKALQPFGDAWVYLRQLELHDAHFQTVRVGGQTSHGLIDLARAPGVKSFSISPAIARKRNSAEPIFRSRQLPRRWSLAFITPRSTARLIAVLDWPTT